MCCKRIAKRLCRIVDKHKKINHEDGRDMFSKEEWQSLYEKCKPEKFKAERSSIEKGRSFYTAYKTPMGEAIEKHILETVQSGYELIDKGIVAMDDIYEMNVYRVMNTLWNKRRLDYKSNIERVRKLIYKGDKK